MQEGFDSSAHGGLGCFADEDGTCEFERRDEREERLELKLNSSALPPRVLPFFQVGVSNDVMLSSKGSAFMEMTIHGLITFNHEYVTNYPTVMFSTG